MNPTHRSYRTRRVAGVLAGLTALLTPITSGPAAFGPPLRADPPR